MDSKYLPQQFESKWIEKWDEENIYKTPQPDKKHKKVYCLSMFPYPSGAGLHVGHARIYTGCDVLARFLRMKDSAVMHPMGWDAFGLPAENAAIAAKKNPMDMVPVNIANFKRQMKMIGFSYDWEKELATTDPNYYRFTQWLFIQFFKMGLLYKKNTPINFCPFCKTGLAEEEVLSDGTHERCGNKITKKELPQWIFRITKYADRLLADLKGLDWPKGIIEMQRNWIGRSEGVNLEFRIHNSESRIKVFTTALDTIFGVTFMVLSPEHPLVDEIKNQILKIKDTDKKLKIKEIEEYIQKAKNKTEIEREAEGKEKTGVFTGLYCINPFNNERVPIWIADYVLMNYGTGAVMGVPGHDARDHEFAKKYQIEKKPVIKPLDKNIKVNSDGFWNYEQIKNEYKNKSILFNSGVYNGLTSQEAKREMGEFIEEKSFGKKTVTYHLRDWIFSRQRYWGEPIPMINCKKCGWVPVFESGLPVKLPYVKNYQPTDTGESPLAKIKDWAKVACPECGGSAKRETDTMPNWAGSCWYFIAFSFWNQEKANLKFIPSYSGQNLKLIKNCLHSEALAKEWKFQIKNSSWLPVDWYLGGAEHAVLHLLYSRFWVKALQDLGLLNFSEPFLRLRNVGMVLAEDHRKMSKSLGNVINPDDVVTEFGADTLRMYEMFMAPFNQEIAWSTKALQGCYRFLKRVWGMYQKYNNCHAEFISASQKKSFKEIPKRVRDDTLFSKNDKQLVAKLQKTIKKVTEDIQQIKFNTAIAAMMEFMNAWESKFQISNFKFQILSKKHSQDFLKVLAPFAPFITEEIWRNVFGENESIHLSPWPKVAGEIIKEEVTIPIQINGKLRGIVTVSAADLSQDKVVSCAFKNAKIKKYLENKKYKVIYIKGKILNFVIL